VPSPCGPAISIDFPVSSNSHETPEPLRGYGRHKVGLGYF
jgi:hypothetical protein